MTYSERLTVLNRYFLFAWLMGLAVSANYLRTVSFPDLRTAAFAGSVWLTYTAIYLLPPFLLSRTIHWLISRKQKSQGLSGTRTAVISGVALLSTGTIHALIFADQFLYRLFDFHLNGFVWNLITTPGGIESMGGSRNTTVTFAMIITGIFAANGLALWGLQKLHNYPPVLSRKTGIFLALAFLCLSMGERVTYGISQLQHHGSVMAAAGAFPFYKPMTLKSLARKLGYEAKPEDRMNMSSDSTLFVNYPLKPLVVKRPEQPLNIVWMVAESLRYDMLDPEIMPNSWKLANKSKCFTHHYSGGNGTRMGMFSLFYGLHGMYWFPFLHAGRGPVLMDVLQSQNYQLECYTSARFTYPEFDRTAFAAVPPENLHQYNAEYGWQSDQKNITDIIEFIRHRDKNRSFMTFMFFESTHARYYFPEESVIRPDYLKKFNYATTAIKKEIGRIKNRYINAAHHLDSQFKRLLETLDREGLMDRTIVLITGDHGEEFMEKGKWGHNSGFTEEQTRVPMILWLPGKKAGQTNRMTSHSDIVATLLPFLGVKNPPNDYCQGTDMLKQPGRNTAVLCDWNRVAIVRENIKLVIPMRGAGMFRQYATTRDDRPLVNPDAVFTTHRNSILSLMQDMKQFRQGKPAGRPPLYIAEKKSNDIF